MSEKQTQEKVLALAKTIKEGDLVTVNFDDGAIKSTVTTEAKLGDNGKDICVSPAAFYSDEDLVIIEHDGIDYRTMKPFLEGGQLGQGVVGLKILKRA